MPPRDVLEYPGDFPQDWPPGPITPAIDSFYGLAISAEGKTGNAGNSPPLAPLTTAGTAVLPTPIGNQQNTSPPAASQPPLTPAGTQGGTPTTGTGPIQVPPTLFPPF